MSDSKTSKHNDDLFKRVVEGKFKEQFNRGLLQGTKAISRVVYDKATDEKRTNAEKIEDIKKFCSVMLSMDVKENPKHEGGQENDGHD